MAGEDDGSLLTGERRVGQAARVSGLVDSESDRELVETVMRRSCVRARYVPAYKDEGRIGRTTKRRFRCRWT